MKLELSEEEIKVIIKLLRSSNPSIDEQQAVVNLVRWLESILKDG